MQRCRVRNLLLEVLRASVDGYLGAPLWFHPDAMRWLSDQAVRPEKLTTAYADAAYKAQIDLTKHAFGKSILITSDGSSYRIVSALAPAAGPEHSLICLTEDREFLLMVRTSAARHQDGTVQVYGAEPSVVLLTPARLRGQLKKQLIEGDHVRSFAFEVRTADGSWVRHPDALNVAQGLLAGFSEVDRSDLKRSPSSVTRSPSAGRMLSDRFTGVLRFARRVLQSRRPRRPKGSS